MAQTVKNTEEIRQIQALMAILLCTKPMGKLHELFEHVLRTPEGPTLSRVTSITDVSQDGLRNWLDSMFSKGNLSVAEKGAVDWQNNSNNMSQAIKELEDVENKLGIKLVVQKK